MNNFHKNSWGIFPEFLDISSITQLVREMNETNKETSVPKKFYKKIHHQNNQKFKMVANQSYQKNPLRSHDFV